MRKKPTPCAPDGKPWIPFDRADNGGFKLGETPLLPPGEHQLYTSNLKHVVRLCVFGETEDLLAQPFRFGEPPVEQRALRPRKVVPPHGNRLTRCFRHPPESLDFLVCPLDVAGFQ